MNSTEEQLAELKALIRFVCSAWYSAHEFILSNSDILADEIQHYSMVQETTTQIALMRIGLQEAEQDKIGTAISKMMDEFNQ